VLDVGAGNGIVGEAVRALGVRSLLGVDILPEAAAAAARDRPGVYDDYLACDLTALSDDERRRLRAAAPNCLITVAPLGFDDMPPEALEEAYDIVADDGWVAFNVKADFLDADDATGVRRLFADLVRSEALEVCDMRGYRHRLSIHREPLDYLAVVGRKRRHGGRFRRAA
jgi:predicted TPR repeat methyltransferase